MSEVVRIPNKVQRYALDVLADGPMCCGDLSDADVGPATRLIMEREGWVERTSVGGLHGWRITEVGRRWIVPKRKTVRA